MDPIDRAVQLVTGPDPMGTELLVGTVVVVVDDGAGVVGEVPGPVGPVGAEGAAGPVPPVTPEPVSPVAPVTVGPVPPVTPVLSGGPRYPGQM